MIISRGAEMGVHIARMGEVRNSYNIVVRKPEGKKLLRIPRCSWEYNIRMDLREIRWGV
jgi:hypothetical protein